MWWANIRTRSGHIRICGGQDPLLRTLVQHLSRNAGSVGRWYPLLLRNVHLCAYLRYRLAVQLRPRSIIVLRGLWCRLPLRLYLPLGLTLSNRDLRLGLETMFMKEERRMGRTSRTRD